MKKIIWVFGMSMMVLCSYVLAQAQLGDWTKSLTITPDVKEENIQEIRNIWLRFCNDGLETDKLTNQLSLQLRPGQSTDICVIFFNNSMQQEKIRMWFWSGDKKDETVSCSTNISWNEFDAMIYQNFSSDFILSWGEKVVKKIRLHVPKSAMGNIYGCIAYYLPDNYSQNPGDLFGVIVRKAAPIEIAVTWSVYTLWRRDGIKDNSSFILKVIIAVLAVRIVVTIFQPHKRKEHHKKK